MRDAGAAGAGQGAAARAGAGAGTAGPPPASPSPRPRAAFYALPPGGLRDYLTLLHLPYTAWCLGTVAIGLGLAPGLTWARLGETLAAFALAVGVAAHALDELRGRPLGTAIPAAVLWALAALSLGGACALGAVAAVGSTLWLLAFVAAGGLLVVAYNLEWPGFHNDAVFSLAWGGFPVLAGYFAVAETLRAEAVLAAVAAALLAHAQRRLSTDVRRLRRRVVAVRGEAELADGTTEPLSRDGLLAAPEAALRALAAAAVALGAALVVAQLG